MDRPPAIGGSRRCWPCSDAPRGDKAGRPEPNGAPGFGATGRQWRRSRGRKCRPPPTPRTCPTERQGRRMAPCRLGELGPLLSMYRVAREGWGSLLEDRRAERWIVAAILLVAVAIRLHHLGKEPLWNDEGFTWGAIGQAWHHLAKEPLGNEVGFPGWAVGQPGHALGPWAPQGAPPPPFYYSLLKLWTAL